MGVTVWESNEIRKQEGKETAAPLPPGVSWNVFILLGLGAIFVDRFDFIGVTCEHEF